MSTSRSVQYWTQRGDEGGSEDLESTPGRWDHSGRFPFAEDLARTTDSEQYFTAVGLGIGAFRATRRVQQHPVAETALAQQSFTGGVVPADPVLNQHRPDMLRSQGNGIRVAAEPRSRRSGDRV